MEIIKFMTIFALLFSSQILFATPLNPKDRGCHLKLLKFSTVENKAPVNAPPFKGKMIFAQEASAKLSDTWKGDLTNSESFSLPWSEFEQARRVRQITNELNELPSFEELLEQEILAENNPWVSIEGYPNYISKKIEYRNSLILELEFLNPRLAQTYEVRHKLGYNPFEIQELFWKLLSTKLGQSSKIQRVPYVRLASPSFLAQQVQMYHALLHLLYYNIYYYKEVINPPKELKKEPEGNLAYLALLSAKDYLLQDLENLIGQISRASQLLNWKTYEDLVNIHRDLKNDYYFSFRNYESIIREGLIEHSDNYIRKVEEENREQEIENNRQNIKPVE